MQAVTTIGLDIAKSVFQIHGVDAEGNVVVRRKLKRRSLLSSRSYRRVSSALRLAHHRIIGRANFRRLGTPCD